MTIVVADLAVFRSDVQNDTPSNGGRMTNNVIVSATIGNLFQEAGETERTAGSDKFRKAFYKVNQNGVDPLANGRVFVRQFTPGEDEMYIFLGDQRNTQNDLTGSENLYGAGALNAGISGGATSLDVAVHLGTDILFRDTETIRMEEGATVEFATISGVPTVLSNVVTITLAAGTANAFTTAAVVSSVLEVGTVQPTFANFITTTAGSGAYDEVTFPLTFINNAVVEESWTLTFTDATNFNIVGDTLSLVGTGSIGSGASPTNPDFGNPYFTLVSGGFSGTFAAADTITFDTSPAAIPVWHERPIPAGTSSNASNDAIVRFGGESG